MTHREIDHALIKLAGTQRGWFSAAQAQARGADDMCIIRRLKAGVLVSRHAGVYRPAAYPDSYVGDLWAAHLAAGPGSYVSHEAAAHLHGLAGFGRQQLVLTVPHPGHARLQGVTVHQLTDAHLHELTIIEGLSVTTVPWTLVDVAAVASKARVGAALDDALAARLTTKEEVGRCLAVIARRGKPGVMKLAKQLDRHANRPVLPKSVLERTLVAGLQAAGEPLPRLQHPHPGRHPMPGCTDGTYVDAKLIVETDGRRWHTRIADVARDRARDNEAARAGYQTLRFLHEDVVNDIADVIATIREVRLARIALLAART